MPLDPKFLAVLACPACETRPPLHQEGETLVCGLCGRIYPIRDGIPILLPEEAAMPGKN